MSGGPRLRGIGTAAPGEMIKANDGLALAAAVSPEVESARLEPLYLEGGVASRSTILDAMGIREHLLEPLDANGRSTPERLSMYLEAASDLGERSARSAMERASITPDEVTHLVTVTCTGAESPGVDQALVKRLGLSPDVSRTNIGFMGCHGAMNGLAVAHAFAAANPDAVVLLTCVEICSIHYLVGTDPWDHKVANAIFADGSGSAVLSSQGEGPSIHGFGSRIFPDTRDLMTWTIGEHGFEMTLSPRVPGILKRNVAGWVDEWLGRSGLSRADIDAWAVHPGGRDILEGVRRGLDLPHDSMDASKHILETHGNMSSGTVLWVLDELLRSGTQGTIAGLAFGPGLVGEGVLVEV